MKPLVCRFAFALAVHLALASLAMAQAPAPAQIPPDPRFKADVLLVVAHPDDETAVGHYLARAIFDQHRSVAVVYTNRGTGGGNSRGVEQSTAMGLIREIEARKATASFGITNVWFLDGKDTPGQDLFASLQNGKHGDLLEQVVRIVRLTRPEVILTWLPACVAGENHGDHQASGVLAVEAFDAAADPTVFPAQVACPRERTDINNANEGLRPWQPKKLYFFSDASHPVKADGPALDLMAVSPSRKVPYVQLAAELMAPHLTQADVSQAAVAALKSGDYGPVRNMLRDYQLIFGKSVVKASPNGDLFEGVTPGELPLARVRGYRPAEEHGIALEFGGAFSFYREFCAAHDLDRMVDLVKPEVAVAAGGYMHMPLMLVNATPDSVDVTLHAVLPQGWTVSAGEGLYHLAPGEHYPVQVFLKTAAAQPWHGSITWEAAAGGKTVGSCAMTVSLSEWTLPQ